MFNIFDRDRAVRRALERQSRIARLRRDFVLVGKCEQILSDPEMFEVFAASCSDKFASERPKGSFIDFFEWLLNNSDSIIALILKVIELFALFAGESNVQDTVARAIADALYPSNKPS